MHDKSISFDDVTSHTAGEASDNTFPHSTRRGVWLQLMRRKFYHLPWVFCTMATTPSPLLPLPLLVRVLRLV